MVTDKTVREALTYMDAYSLRKLWNQFCEDNNLEEWYQIHLMLEFNEFAVGLTPLELVYKVVCSKGTFYTWDGFFTKDVYGFYYSYTESEVNQYIKDALNMLDGKYENTPK